MLCQRTIKLDRGLLFKTHRKADCNAAQDFWLLNFFNEFMNQNLGYVC